MENEKNVLWFSEIGIKDIPYVGGKGASLGEMVRNNFPIPPGFCVTAQAYFRFIEEKKLMDIIVEKIDSIDVENTEELTRVSKEVRQLIRQTRMPEDLRREIIGNYRKMGEKRIAFITSNEAEYVAVRSSATAEDLPEASFAGQQETYLNIKGEDAVVLAVQNCWASLFTARAVYYRKKNGFSTAQVGLSAVIQKMVQSDVSGVMFTVDPNGNMDHILIEAGLGLGETVVSGSITPDDYIVDNKSFKIIDKKINYQEWMLAKQGKENVRIDLGRARGTKQKLSDDFVIKLAKIGKQIETHYTKPMDIEWALEGKELYIVQARPITAISSAAKEGIKTTDEPLIKGLPASPGIVTGIVKVVPTIEDIAKVVDGDILVTKMTAPSWVPIMKKASGIITNEGGRTCFGGDTKLLTNKGFMSFREINENGFDGLSVLSFNKNTKKTEWKSIICSMKRNSEKINISVSQSGKIDHNTLTLTPDHKMINIRNGEITDTEIQEMLNQNEFACVAQKIPPLTESTEKQRHLAYLLGGIITDGSIYTSRTHGEVQFIQKETDEKKEFIKYMQQCVTKVYRKSFKKCIKNVSTGTIRGSEVRGQATAFRLYSKDIANNVLEEEQKIVLTILQGDEEISLNFLAGVIDGDGTFFNNRIQIYISEENLLQAATVACLKLGIVPQITKNRAIYNMQIVEKLDKIFEYTKRVKGIVKNRKIKTRFFGAKQVLVDGVNYRLKERASKNLLVSEEELKKIDNQKIKSLIESDLRMQRIKQVGDTEFGEVFNITVEDNYTYIVFTKNLTPIAVNNCHASIVSRELGIPCVVGTEKGTEILKDGQEVTIDGYNGLVYNGKVEVVVKENKVEVLKDDEIDSIEERLGDDFQKPIKEVVREKAEEIEKKYKSEKFSEMSEDKKEAERKELLDLLKDLSIKVKVNVALPDVAEQAAATKADGVGLLRAEHMITSSGKHPAEFIRNNQDEELKEYVKKGIRTVAEKFSGPVWFRTFDARTDEFKELEGGDKEPKEDNPMLGWHGIRRDIDDPRMLKAQFKAIKELHESGQKNVGVMLPFVEVLDEVIEAKKIAEEVGLPKEVDFGVMIETPASVWIIDELIPHIKFISFGTNDLTQLTLGLDRNNEHVQKWFNEQHPAILREIEYVIKKCKQAGVTTSICGQAASNPDMVKKLVWMGIDSVSANIDAVENIRNVVMAEEKKKILENYKK